MGTWGVGPFGSDTALDFLDNIKAARPDERMNLIARILESGSQAASASSDLLPEEVIAAAAVVAAHVEGGESLPWNEEVVDVSELLPRPISAPTATLAIEALNSAIPADGWWWQSWVDESDRTQAWESMSRVRAVLASVN